MSRFTLQIQGTKRKQPWCVVVHQYGLARERPHRRRDSSLANALTNYKNPFCPTCPRECPPRMAASHIQLGASELYQLKSSVLSGDSWHSVPISTSGIRRRRTPVKGIFLQSWKQGSLEIIWLPKGKRERESQTRQKCKQQVPERRERNWWKHCDETTNSAGAQTLAAQLFSHTTICSLAWHTPLHRKLIQNWAIVLQLLSRGHNPFLHIRFVENPLGHGRPGRNLWASTQKCFPAALVMGRNLFLYWANGRGGSGSQTAADPPFCNPRKTPEEQTVGSVTTSHKMLTSQTLSSSLNSGTAKRGCLGRGKVFGWPPAFCPPTQPRPFTHYRLLTPGHPIVRVRNILGKTGPQNLCLCCFSSLTLAFQILRLSSTQRDTGSDRHHKYACVPLACLCSF